MNGLASVLPMALAAYEEKRKGAAPVIRQYSDSVSRRRGDGPAGPIWQIGCSTHGPRSGVEDHPDKFQVEFNVSGNRRL